MTTVPEMVSNRVKRLGPPTLPEPVLGLVGLYRAREPGDEQDNFIRLNHNERLQPLPAWFMEIIRRSVESTLLTKYPFQDRLHKQLCDEQEVAEDQIVLTSGSDGAVKALYQAYIRPGDGVVMLDPSYAMYSVYAQMFQAKAISIPFDHNLELDTRFLLNSIVAGARLVVLANPNQPTGTLLNEEVLVRLVQRTGEVGALLAIDEAYYPFSHYSVMLWIKKVPHILVIRSLSKAPGLAGLRIGFVAGHRNVVANLYKVRSAHDVNSMAILCASEILKHPQIIDDYVAEVKAGGQLLAERVRALELTPLPTHTNFMLIRVGHRVQPASLIEGLRHRGYLVKGPFTTPCLADCIRVTLGPPDVMAGFVECLQEVLELRNTLSRGAQ